MTLNIVNLRRAVTVMKYLASVVSLIFLPKTLIYNKVPFPTSNSPNFAELENELRKSITKIIYQSFFLALSFVNHELPVLGFWG